MRKMYYSVNDTGILEKKIQVLLSGVEPKTFLLLVRMLYHWVTILRDPGADSGAEDENQNGRGKKSMSKSTKEKYEPLGTNSLHTSSKRPNDYKFPVAQW